MPDCLDDVQFPVSVEVGDGDRPLRNRRIERTGNCRRVGDLLRRVECAVSVAEHHRQKVGILLQNTGAFDDQIDVAVAVEVAVAHHENALKRLRSDRSAEGAIFLS